MPFCLVRHKVADFDKWKKAFDAHGEKRQKAGCRGGFVFQNDDDAKEVLVLLDFAEVGPMKKFLESSDLKDVMKDAGVEGKPDIVTMEKWQQTKS